MTNHNISNHYESHTSTSYESAFFYSEKEYTTWLCNLVRDAFGIPPCGDDKLVVDGGTTRCGCNSDKHYSDDSALATADDSGRERKKRVLLDVGGGTGNFTSMVISGVDTLEGVVIDPFLPASSTSSSSNEDGKKENGQRRLKFVKASAEEFIPSGHKLHTSNIDEKKEDDVIPWWKTGYNHVLLKEVVHHFDANERVGIFTGIRNGLIKNNKHGMDESIDGSEGAEEERTPSQLLVITRPRVHIDYPMWSAAKDVWATNQPSANDIVSDLRKAGFQDVQQSIKSYPCEIELNRWVDMVRNRFWSTFSHFTDEEIEEGCERIMKEIQQPDGQEVMIQFEERLVFITARK